MRFEELLRYNGPVRDIDHSFRLSVHENASTEADEKDGSLFKPDLTGITWVELVGYQNPDDNLKGNEKTARLWGDAVGDVDFLESSKRYGGRPQYATSKEKTELCEKLNALKSDTKTIDDLNVFIRYLKWLKWNTSSLLYWRRNALEKAEQSSWSALQELFTLVVDKLKAEAAKAAVDTQHAAAKEDQEDAEQKIASTQVKIEAASREIKVFEENDEKYKQAAEALRKAQEAHQEADRAYDNASKEADRLLKVRGEKALEVTRKNTDFQTEKARLTNLKNEKAALEEEKEAQTTVKKTAEDEIWKLKASINQVTNDLRAKKKDWEVKSGKFILS